MEASRGRVYQAKGMANVKSQAGLRNELRGQLGAHGSPGKPWNFVIGSEWDRQPLDGSV